MEQIAAVLHRENGMLARSKRAREGASEIQRRKEGGGGGETE
jgi:hypothetical protein